jgi:putative membrane protein
MNLLPDSNIPPNFKSLRLIVIIISVALPLFVAGMFQFKFTDFVWPFDVHILPLINAVLNAASAVLLIAALVAVKNKNIDLHQKLIYSAMFLSLLFLLVYVLYHITAVHTKFGGEGAIKIVYLSILASHIILAAVQAPFVLFAFLYGYTGQIEKHKKLVKFSYPIWLYVSVTGVICYLMISPYYL